MHQDNKGGFYILVVGVLNKILNIQDKKATVINMRRFMVLYPGQV